MRACPAEATAACPSLPRAAEAAEETPGVLAGASVHSAGFLGLLLRAGPCLGGGDLRCPPTRESRGHRRDTVTRSGRLRSRADGVEGPWDDR